MDAATRILLADGFDAVTIPSIARAARAPRKGVAELFATPDDALVAVLNREFGGMYGSIVDQIERDPRGGLLSRIQLYMVSVVYERPLARVLFMIDRNALNQVMRHTHAFRYVPDVATRADLIHRLQEVGMVRPDVDAMTLAHMLGTWSAGLALTAPHLDLDLAVRGMSDLIARTADTNPPDTSEGKRVFYSWATDLTRPA
jgi:AcrR family transcriptional regulator